VGIARAKSWSSYERFWKDEQKKKDPHALACLAAERTEDEAQLLAAHIVPGTRLWFNPLLGSGGNASNRSFSKGWTAARDELAKALAPAAGSSATVVADLGGFLRGGDCVLEKDWGAGSWFSQAVETANSGQAPTSKGQVTPWAMLLACEALRMFAGSPSRRLGSRARATAAFPFATEGPAPGTQGEAGKARAELWLPLWERPMTLPELRWLFWRARAEVGPRGATTPAAFGAAVLRRGVDAGLTGFARFRLASTTGQTFEPHFEGLVSLVAPAPAVAQVEGRVAESVLGLFEQLPRDEKVGKRWRIRGFRAPIERALVARAAEPANSATARIIADALVRVLDRVDRSQPVRRQGLRWHLLPCAWLLALFGDEEPPLEARLAMAVASLLPTGEVPAFPAYRFGLELNGNWAQHPPQPPARWVWRARDVEQGLIALVHRRLVEAERKGEDRGGGSSLPFSARVYVSLADVGAWLRGNVDESLLARWIGRMALLDWRGFRQAGVADERLRKLVRPRSEEVVIDGNLALYGLLRPLVDPRTIIALDGRPLLAEESRARTVGAARRLAALLSVGATAAALDHARSRYAIGLRPLAAIGAPLTSLRPRRLLASLAFGAPEQSLARVAERFLRPRRAERKERMA
jgi:CRISPR-associated protein Csx17